jgi:GT2 family glycosyltransferase
VYRERVTDISVVAPTYNRGERIRPLLAALEAQTLPASCFEVIFVDDCSCDGTPDLLAGLAEITPLEVRVLSTPTNSGGAAAPRNIGWRAAKAPIVAFIDDDCLPAAGWLESGLAMMRADPDLGVIQGRVVPPSDYDVTHPGPWDVWRKVEGETPWFEGSNLFYRRAALEDAGGFNEEFGIWGEDSDLGWKVVERGWKRGFAASATVEHEVQTRDWTWWLRFAWKDENLVHLAAAHPQVRTDGFWRPWAVRRDDVPVAVFVAGCAIALRWRPAVLLAAPYLWRRRPREGISPAEAVQLVMVDLSRLAGRLKGSVAEGIFVV